jgi:hypothetical protein
LDSEDIIRDYKRSIRDTNRFIIIVLGFSIIIGIVFTLLNLSAPDQYPTKQQAQKELCILEKELKYPTTSNYTINRLCYLEELGRSSVVN